MAHSIITFSRFLAGLVLVFQSSLASASNGVERGGGEDLGFSFKSAVREVVLDLRTWPREWPEAYAEISPHVSGLDLSLLEARLENLLIDESESSQTEILCPQDQIKILKAEWEGLSENSQGRKNLALRIMLDCMSSQGQGLQTAEMMVSAYSEAAQKVNEDLARSQQVLTLAQAEQAQCSDSLESVVAQVRSSLVVIDLLEPEDGALTAWSLYLTFGSQMMPRERAEDLLKDMYRLNRREYTRIEERSFSQAQSISQPVTIRAATVLQTRNQGRYHYGSARVRMDEYMQQNTRRCDQGFSRLMARVNRTMMQHLLDEVAKPSLTQIANEVERILEP